MTPYIDGGFLSVLLVKTPGRKVAWRTFHRFNPPYALNYLHDLQMETSSCVANSILMTRSKPSDWKGRGSGGFTWWKGSLKSNWRVGMMRCAWRSVGHAR